MTVGIQVIIESNGAAIIGINDLYFFPIAPHQFTVVHEGIDIQGSRIYHVDQVFVPFFDVTDA